MEARIINNEHKISREKPCRNTSSMGYSSRKNQTKNRRCTIQKLDKVLVFEDYDDHKVILSVSSNFYQNKDYRAVFRYYQELWLVENLKINDIQIIVSKKDSERFKKI